jgi:DNA repair exonuclease SbcCD ATPase subunit
MIKFQKLRFKNFLSTGNSFTEIDFINSPTTLVVGHNGAGKSTMLDALSFGLFGKPHRKISKAQLVNSINGKGSMVEVEFSIGSQNYKIVRGIKPNTFEIWQGGNMINQNSHAKEYQQVLEKNILKLTHKSFHQIVVLGSSSFVPFMQLSGGARREVIEDLLDINVFSKMNSLLKEKMSILKDEIQSANHNLEMCKTKINAQKKYLRDLNAVNTAYRKEKEEKIEEINAEIKELQERNSYLSKEVEEKQPPLLDDIAKLTKQTKDLTEYMSSFRTQIKQVVKESKFFEENEVCPSCDQDISQEIRDEKVSVAKEKAQKLNETMVKAKEKEEDFKSLQECYDAMMEAVRNWQNELNNNNQTISRLQNNITSIQNDLAKAQGETGDLEKANKELETLRESELTLTENKFKLNEQMAYHTVNFELLKDTGIKTKIIKQYIPVINQLTNQYLQILDFFVHFDLDESFQETIRSRHRDAFTYDSFSEGEKQRIDLSLLFTWRQIAKMKNSVATNLLILDETFDSSLDDDGVDNLMKIINSLGEDTHVFVISHKGELEDAAFERRIEFVKEKNFSKVKEAA